MKASKEVLAEALQGRVRDHHRFMIRSHLRLIDAIREEVAGIDERIGEHLKPFRGAVQLLKTIPGISDIAAHVLLGEIGDDMSRFPSAGHLVSWAGLCPRNDESAGRRRSTRRSPAGSDPPCRCARTALVCARLHVGESPGR